MFILVNENPIQELKLTKKVLDKGIQ